MLTTELLKAQDALNGLTDDQLNAIVTLSKNDEDAVMGARLGEIYRDMDDKITNTLGVQRMGNEKTRDFLLRAAQEYTSKYSDYDTVKASVASLTSEKERLERQLQDGAGDKELKTKYEQLSAELGTTKKAYTDLQAKFDKAETDHKAAMLDLEVDNELRTALSTLKMKAGMPESAITALTDRAFAQVKAMHPDFISNAEGKRVLIFRDENGATRNNAANQLQPFTARELLSNELKTLGILDEGRKQTGGGTGTPPPPPTSNVDITSARTRVEADNLIEKYLLQQGHIKGTADFNAKMLETRKQYTDLYANLPY